MRAIRDLSPWFISPLSQAATSSARHAKPGVRPRRSRPGRRIESGGSRARPRASFRVSSLSNRFERVRQSFRQSFRDTSQCASFHLTRHLHRRTPVSERRLPRSSVGRPGGSPLGASSPASFRCIDTLSSSLRIRTYRGCAEPWRIGRRNCGCCKRAKDWPPLRHVWPTFAPAPTAWSVGQRSRDMAGKAGIAPEAKKPAAAGAGRARKGRSNATG